MSIFRRAVVTRVGSEQGGHLGLTLDCDGVALEAVADLAMTGPVAVGDDVVVNTAGIDLGLGTGGVAFVLWDLDGPGPSGEIPGHIVKLRYTPWQRAVLAADAPESPHHEALADLTDLGGMPVVACSLHSQVPAAVAGVKAERPGARVGYLMTDGGALPLGFSRLVAGLRAAGLLDATCTAGHAFGGDLEAVNVFSGLAALAAVARCDVVVAGMGPGVVGTGTALGTTALEQGQLLDAAAALRGAPVAALRISFDDPRPRHTPVSHHSVTALTVAARTRATVAVPKLAPERSRALAAALDDSGICARHDTETADGRPGLRLLADAGLDPATMGRPMSASPEPFLAASAAGVVAARRLPD